MCNTSKFFIAKNIGHRKGIEQLADAIRASQRHKNIPIKRVETNRLFKNTETGDRRQETRDRKQVKT